MRITFRLFDHITHPPTLCYISLRLDIKDRRYFQVVISGEPGLVAFRVRYKDHLIFRFPSIGGAK